MAVFTVAFGFEILGGNKTQGGGVYAVAHAAGGRTIGKNVSKVGLATFGTDLGADHAVGVVGLFDDFCLIEGLGKAGPTGARVEFIGGGEKGTSGDDIDVDPRFFVVPIGILKRRLGAAFAGHGVLDGSKAFAEFRFVHGKRLFRGWG